MSVTSRRMENKQIAYKLFCSVFFFGRRTHFVCGLPIHKITLCPDTTAMLTATTTTTTVTPTISLKILSKQSALHACRAFVCHRRWALNSTLSAFKAFHTEKYFYFFSSAEAEVVITIIMKRKQRTSFDRIFALRRLFFCHRRHYRRCRQPVKSKLHAAFVSSSIYRCFVLFYFYTNFRWSNPIFSLKVFYLMYE